MTSFFYSSLDFDSKCQTTSITRPARRHWMSRNTTLRVARRHALVRRPFRGSHPPDNIRFVMLVVIKRKEQHFPDREPPKQRVR